MRMTLFRAFVIFLILLITTSLIFDVFNTPFGTVDFFAKHGYLFLVSIALFPRLTLLFSSVASGGVMWWLGFVFCPRILVATLATMAYFKTNPVLVTISWMVALSGETLEKVGLKKPRSQFIFRTSGFGRRYRDDMYESRGSVIDKNGVIEAEFEKK